MSDEQQSIMLLTSSKGVIDAAKNAKISNDITAYTDGPTMLNAMNDQLPDLVIIDMNCFTSQQLGQMVYRSNNDLIRENLIALLPQNDQSSMPPSVLFRDSQAAYDLLENKVSNLSCVTIDYKQLVLSLQEITAPAIKDKQERHPDIKVDHQGVFQVLAQKLQRTAQRMMPDTVNNENNMFPSPSALNKQQENPLVITANPEMLELNDKSTTAEKVDLLIEGQGMSCSAKLMIAESATQPDQCIAVDPQREYDQLDAEGPLSAPNVPPPPEQMIAPVPLVEEPPTPVEADSPEEPQLTEPEPAVEERETSLPVQQPQLPSPDPPETVPLEQPNTRHLIGTAIIAVFSASSGAGGTHTAMMLAYWLRRQGYRVACLELNKSGQFSRMGQFHSKTVPWDTSYRLHGIDFAWNKSVSELKASREYDYIVLDFGIFFELDANGQMDLDRVYHTMQRPNSLDEFHRADLQICVGRANPLTLPNLLHFTLQPPWANISRRFIIAVVNAPPRTIRDLENRHPFHTFVLIPDQPDQFDRAMKWPEKVLAGVLPTNTKKRGLWLAR